MNLPPLPEPAYTAYNPGAEFGVRVWVEPEVIAYATAAVQVALAQQRQPLSDDEIREHFVMACEHPLEKFALVFARRVEQAHKIGITGEKT